MNFPNPFLVDVSDLIDPDHDNKTYKGGYEADRFVETPRKDFICPICYGVVKYPLECTQCGGLLCKECSSRCNQANRRSHMYYAHRNKLFSCPVCRFNAPPREPSQILLRMLKDLQLYCKNQLNGCPEILTIGTLKQHKEECNFSQIRCANHRFCFKSGKRDDFILVKPSFFKINDSNMQESAEKDKFVCSSVCRKVVIMEHKMKMHGVEEVLEMYRHSLLKLNTLSLKRFKTD